MPILTATELGHSFGADDLFEDINLKVEDRDRVGLVGPNGVGKTTLLLLLAGQLAPTTGRIDRAREVTTGTLRQEAVLAFAGQENSVYEEMGTVFSSLREREIELHEMEAAMSSGESSAQLLQAYGRLQEQCELAGGYSYQVEIKRVLQGLGFPSQEWDTPLLHLSGGQKTRVLLGRLLLEKPDLLILDEPTNHLDITAVEWLERTLRSWAGALIIVSHDRYFLDAVVSQVWEMNGSHLTAYRGNYSNFVRQRQEAWERERRLFSAQKERLENELAFIRKHIAGGKRDIAKGKLKRLTRDIILIEQVGVSGMEGKSWLEIGGRVRTFSANEAARRLRALKPPGDGPPPLNIRLQAEQRSARSVLRARRVTIGYENKPLITVNPFQLDRLDCAAILGPNGSGKSTFLRTVLGELRPLEGSLKLGDGVQVGYFAQAHEQLNSRNRVIDELLAHKPMSEEDARNYLAAYLFRGEDVFKNIGELSGGERGRLALSLLAADGANLLLLDEPTNHLDIPSQEILQAVLERFDGTILLVSHDRYLVNRLANQIWQIEDGRMHVFKGDYEAYQRFREAEQQGLPLAVPSEERTEREMQWVDDLVPPPVSKKELRDRKHRLYVLQGAIEDAEFRLQQLQYQLTHSSPSAVRQAELREQISNAKSELDALNNELDVLAI
jgi:ATP-binding cassette subfamily F protein 3